MAPTQPDEVKYVTPRTTKAVRALLNMANGSLREFDTAFKAADQRQMDYSLDCVLALLHEAAAKINRLKGEVA